MRKVKLSMYAAFAGGILVPLLETIRRWNQLADVTYFISWFDDYLIGGFLFFAALKSFKSIQRGQKYLNASWGIATGMAFYSFFGQLQSLDRPDPAPISPSSVVVIKGTMLVISLISLVFSLEDNFENKK